MNNNEIDIKKRNLFYIILISVFLLLIILIIFGTDSGQNTSIYIKLLLISGLLFFFLVYLRMFYIYKLEKFQGKHNYPSFVDFLNKTFSRFRVGIIILYFPYFKKLPEKRHTDARNKINLISLIIYLITLFSVFLVLNI